MLSTREHIAAAPERVWAVLVDVNRWPRWTPTVTSAELLDGGEFRVGSRARLSQPGMRDAVWTVDSLAPNSEFTWSSSYPGLKVIGEHRITACDTESEVTLCVTFRGLLAPLIQLLIGNRIKSFIAQEIAGLKKFCEQSAHGRECSPTASWSADEG